MCNDVDAIPASLLYARNAVSAMQYRPSAAEMSPSDARIDMLSLRDRSQLCMFAGAVRALNEVM